MTTAMVVACAHSGMLNVAAMVHASHPLPIDNRMTQIETIGDHVRVALVRGFSSVESSSTRARDIHGKSRLRGMAAPTNSATQTTQILLST